MFGPLLTDTRTVISNDDTLQATQGVPFEFDRGAFRVGVESIPYEF